MPYFGIPLGQPRQPIEQPVTKRPQGRPPNAHPKLRKPQSKNVVDSSSTLDLSQTSRLGPTRSTPNLKQAKKHVDLPELPPTLPPRAEQRAKNGAPAPANQVALPQRLSASQRDASGPQPKRSQAQLVSSIQPAQTRPHLQPAPPPPTYSSMYPSGSIEPDQRLTEEISDRMSTILTAIDEQEALVPAADDNRLVQPDNASLPRHKTSRFAKSWLYSNSRLPPALPPLKLYIPTWPLLCLCAQHSLAVYTSKATSPAATTGRPASINTLIPARALFGTKAISLTTHPLSTSNHIIIAIRGTATLSDWAVNTWSTPASPAGFLPDTGNLVHAGFLHVARAMAPILAAKLRAILADKGERAKSSLVLTGHSAGGAVAALLYAHIIALDDASLSPDLRSIAGRFKRTHCVTFGAPPVSLLPIQKPATPPGTSDAAHKRLSKSVFFAFANEGDPVVRADPAIARSLLGLYTAPPPARASAWPVPPGAYSLAGRVILLRGAMRADAHKKRAGGLGMLFKKGVVAETADVGRARDVAAFTASDDMFRGVVFGDPVMHSMRVYRERVEALAVLAVTGG